MRNIFIYCITLLTLFSCVKDGHDRDESADRITISPYIPQTKANGFIENTGDLNTSGYSMVVYDYMAKDNSTGWYMDGVTMECDANGGWHYSGDYEDSEFLWLDKTNHRFFGWLIMNSDIVKPSFVKDDMLLTIPDIEFKSDTPITDFMYSGVQTRYYEKAPADGSRPDISSVDLEMKHLFSAFRFYVKNQRGTAININSVTLKNIYTKKNAQISYGRTPEILSYFPSDPVNITGKTGEITTGKHINAFGSDDNYFMVWPQTTEEFASASVEVKFTQGGVAQTKTFDLTELGQTEWLPGYRYSYNITFTDKEIKLTCVVEDWQVVPEEIDFSDQVTVSATMTWENVRSVNYGTGEVILYDDVNTPAKCTFHILTPKGATWTASLIPIEGHQDAFSFVEGTKYGAVGGEGDSHFELYVNNQAPIAPMHICKLRITVQTSDGRTIVVKNLVPTRWLDANGTSHPTNGYEEFTVIQNLING